MKKIEAIIRPAKLDDVRAAVAHVAVDSLTVSEVKGLRRSVEPGWMDLGSSLYVHTCPSSRWRSPVRDADVDYVLDAIQAGGRTGEPGDGKIFVLDLPEGW